MTKRRAWTGALAFFIVWTVATWFFEGRIETLLRPDATGDRIVYAFAVNLVLAIGGGIVLLRYWHRAGAIDAALAGFRPSRKTAAAIVAGFILGLAAYVLQGAPSMNPVVIVNAFSQVFVVSAAEVIVCWAIVGVATEANLASRGSALSLVGAALLASVLFGLYHYAHSAPFNTLPMVALLSVVGLVTSVFFFISRDVAGTIVFHNFLGTFGVVQALAAAKSLSLLEQLQAPLIVAASITAALLVAGYVVLGAAGAGAATPLGVSDALDSG
jgi:hypothetical protein